jgi:hypothetical protein
LEYIHWPILYDSLHEACLLWQNDQNCGRTLYIYGKKICVNHLLKWV